MRFNVSSTPYTDTELASTSQQARHTACSRALRSSCVLGMQSSMIRTVPPVLVLNSVGFTALTP